jgi:hypothetical protein
MAPSSNYFVRRTGEACFRPNNLFVREQPQASSRLLAPCFFSMRLQRNACYQAPRSMYFSCMREGNATQLDTTALQQR